MMVEMMGLSVVTMAKLEITMKINVCCDSDYGGDDT